MSLMNRGNNVQRLDLVARICALYKNLYYYYYVVPNNKTEPIIIVFSGCLSTNCTHTVFTVFGLNMFPKMLMRGIGQRKE